MGRLYNGKGRRVVIGKQSGYTGIEGGSNLARSGKTSWVPGNTQYAGFGSSYTNYGCRIKKGAVSLWTFGEGTGTTLQDVAALTEQQDLTFNTPQGTWPNTVSSSNFTWKFNSDLGRWHGSVSGLSATASTYSDKAEPNDGGTCELTQVIMDQWAKVTWNEFSVELWLSSSPDKPAGLAGVGTIIENSKDGPDCLVEGVCQPNWSITDYNGSAYGVQVRSDLPPYIPPIYKGGKPGLGNGPGGIDHIVLTCEPGGFWLLESSIRLWVNGKLEIDVLQDNCSNCYEWEWLAFSWQPPGLGAGWIPQECDGDDYHTCYTTKLGRRWQGSKVWPREWTGDYYMAATYDRALQQDQVLTNYAAGPTFSGLCPPQIKATPVPLVWMGLPPSSILHNCVNCNPTQYPPTTVCEVWAIGKSWERPSINVNYSLSSPDGLVEGIDYADKTPHGYATLLNWYDAGGKGTQGEITLSAIPTSTSSGEIHITVSAVSDGIFGCPSLWAGNWTPPTYDLSCIQHVMTLSAYDASCSVVGYGDRTLLSDYVSGLPIPFRLKTKGDQTAHSYDVSAPITVSAHPSNIGSYAITPSTIVFEAGKTQVSNNILAPAFPYEWADEDSVRLVVSSADSDSGHTLSANVDEVITISNDQNLNKPGPGNTGCRIPDYQLKDPTNEWWYDSTTNFVSANPGMITGYKFNQAVLSTDTERTDGLFFADCVFDGRDANGVDSISNVIYGNDTNRARDLMLLRCTVRNSKVTLISGCLLKSVIACDFFESGTDGIHGLGASGGCTIRDNWIHQIGRKKNFGGVSMYGISLWGATSGATITGNYVDTRSTELPDCDPITGVIGPGTSINCHAPHVRQKPKCNASFDDYTPNGCIEVISLKDTVSGTVDVSGNWFGGWNTYCHTYGELGGLEPSAFGATVTIQKNRYERDFVGDFIVSGDMTGGTIAWDTSGPLPDTWEDTGEYIHQAVYQSPRLEWSLFACEFYGNCPPGSNDPDLDCSYYC